jgi:hypothetical protein
MQVAANYLPDPGDLVRGKHGVAIDGTGTAMMPFDIRNCSVALRRFLLSLSPASAEVRWWERGIPRPEGRWVEIREKGEPSFYTFSDGTSGRSGRTLPAGVDRNDLFVTTIPSPPPTVLREYFNRLTDQFPSNDPWKEPQKKYSKILEEMYQPDYKPLVMDDALTDIRETLKVGAPEPSLLDQFEQDVNTSYINFQIPAYVGGELCLMARILKLIYPYRFTFVPGLQTDSPPDLVSPLQESQVELLVSQLLGRSPVRGRILDAVWQACNQLQQQGEILQDSALETNNVGQFYGRLFASIIWLQGATKGLRLLEYMEIGKPSDKIRIQANVCEERVVISATSMHGQFADTLDKRDLILYRETVRRARKEKGEAVAEQLADQYIETHMFYPRFVRSVLLDKQASPAS